MNPSETPSSEAPPPESSIPEIDGIAADSYRLIPSRFPPIGLFDTVTAADDLEAVMELEGWTNDRLVAHRLARLPREEWVYGRPNSSIVMAAFLHAAPRGMRFNGPHLGAWYAALSERTAIAEVSHHLRREALACGWPEMRGTYRSYGARLTGRYADLRGLAGAWPDLYDPHCYDSAQAFGEAQRPLGRGVIYDSLRHRGGTCVAALRPRAVQAVTQASHFDLIVPVTGAVIARRLAGDA